MLDRWFLDVVIFGSIASACYDVRRTVAEGALSCTKSLGTSLGSSTTLSQNVIFVKRWPVFRHKMTRRVRRTFVRVKRFCSHGPLQPKTGVAFA